MQCYSVKKKPSIVALAINDILLSHLTCPKSHPHTYTSLLNWGAALNDLFM